MVSFVVAVRQPLGVLCIAVAAASAYANVWTTESVQEGAQLIEVSRQALVHDQAGRPHYFYGGSHLYHKYFDGQTWQKEIVDPAPRTGRLARVAIGPDGRFHIAYLDEYVGGPNSRSYRYAVGNTGSWATEQIPGITGNIESIAVDSSGRPYLASRGGCTEIALDTKSGTSWTHETVASFTTCITGGSGEERLVSVVIGGSDQPHLLYYFDPDGTLQHSRRSGGVWAAEIVATADHNEHSSFARGPGDVLYACYQRFSPTSLALYCANNATGSWQQTLVDEGSDLGPIPRQLGAYPSALVDSNGAVHVSYYALTQTPGSTYFIRHATNASGTWSVRSVATSLSFPSPTILGLDGTGNPILGYKERGASSTPGVDMALKRLAWNGTGWDTSDVDTGLFQPQPVGLNPVVAVDAAGFMHTAYLLKDDFAFYLQYATNRTGSWISEKFGVVGVVTFAGLAIRTDDAGAAHIVFSEKQGSGSVLKYRTNLSGSWVESEISPINWPGVSREVLTVAYVLKNGVSHIAFIVRSTVKAELHYVTNATGAWSDLMVFDFGAENAEIASYYGTAKDVVWADLAIAANGDANIVFGHGDLKYARIGGGGVSVQTVLAPGFDEHWGNRSLAVTSDGVKYLAFEKLVQCVGTYCPVGMYLNSDETGQWQETVIDSEVYFDADGPVYFYTPRDPVLSVAGGTVKIAYYHDAYEHIRVASRGACGYTSVVASDAPFRIGSEFRYNLDGRSFTAIRSLPDGLARMTYYDQANGRLMAARSSPGVSLCANNSPFADVPTGQSAESDFVVSNDSGRSANVAPVAFFISAPFSIAKDGCSGRVLAPGSTCSLRMRFTPTSARSEVVPFAVEYVLDTGYDQAIFATVKANSVPASSPPPSVPPPGGSTGGGSTSGGSSGGGGCFIATAAFGSPLAAEVDYLRRFRDKYLMVSSPGRSFVNWYYRHSPPVADFLRTHDYARYAVRLLLTVVVDAIKPLVTSDSVEQLKGAHSEKGKSQAQATQAAAVHGLRRNRLGTVRVRPSGVFRAGGT